MHDTFQALAGITTWLTSSISGLPDHQISPEFAWHGRLMVLAWGILLPSGALIARFFKVLPGQDWPRELDNRLWWNAHRGLQYSGVALSVIGVAVILQVTPGATPWRNAHTVLGWLITWAGVLQVVSGWMRGSTGGPGRGGSGNLEAPSPGDHYLMTGRRIWFERVHKTLGWFAVVIAMATIVLGLLLADSPRWMPLLLLAWWLALAGVFAYLQHAGWCFDTYQAIWGPSPAHPGNRCKPIGPGIIRFDHVDDDRPS